MAIDGDLYSLRKTSILELLGVCIPPRGFIEELDSVIKGDADAKTTLVRRQSTLYEYYGDNDDDESGEEEDENYD